MKYLFLSLASLALLAGCTSNEEQIESGNSASQVETQTKQETTSETEVDKKNEDLGLTTSEPKETTSKPSQEIQSPSLAEYLSSVDTDGNGKVSTKEAEDAGFKMTITKDHWLYQYMEDQDGDGSIGE